MPLTREQRAMIECLEGKISSQERDAILHPNGPTIFSLAAMKAFSDRLREYNAPTKTRLESAGMTLAQAMTAQLREEMSMDALMKLLYG